MIDKKFETLANKLNTYFDKFEKGITLSDEERAEFEALKAEVNKIDIFDVYRPEK